MAAFPTVSINSIPRGFSDHSQVLLRTHYMNFGPPLFQFFNSWLFRDTLYLVFKQVCYIFYIGGHVDRVLSDKICFVKEAIRRWKNSEYEKENKALLDLKNLTNDLDCAAETRRLSPFKINKLKNCRHRIL